MINRPYYERRGAPTQTKDGGAACCNAAMTQLRLPPCAWCEPVDGPESRVDWALENGPYVRLMAEIYSAPVWTRDGVGDIVEALPIGDDLKRAIMQWGDDYTDIGDRFCSEELIYECSPHFPLRWYNARGAALADRLRAELGDGWTVDYSMLRRSYCN